MKKAIQFPYDNLFANTCQAVANAGFKCISVNFADFLDRTEEEWKKATDEIGNILAKNGLECIQSHPYYYDLRVSSEIVEERYEFAIKQAIIATGALGGEWCVIHPRSSVSSGFMTSKSLEDNKKAFSEYIECAVKANTGIAAENLPIFGGMKPIWPFYSSNFEDLANLVDSLGDRAIGICWDTGHANLMNFDQAVAFDFLKDRIKCTHIHNNYKLEDDHNSPDIGNIPWEKVMPALIKNGYKGALCLESRPYATTDMNVREAYAKHNLVCLDYLEKLARGD